MWLTFYGKCSYGLQKNPIKINQKSVNLKNLKVGFHVFTGGTFKGHQQYDRSGIRVYGYISSDHNALYPWWGWYVFVGGQVD